MTATRILIESALDEIRTIPDYQNFHLSAYTVTAGFLNRHIR